MTPSRFDAPVSPPPPAKPAQDMGEVVAKALVRGVAFAAATAIAGPIFGGLAVMFLAGDDGSDCPGCTGE